MSKVYVVQEPTKYDPVSKTHQARLDLSPAQAFGELVFLVPPGFFGFDPSTVIQGMAAKLIDYSDDDYILCTGAPDAIGWAVAIAARKNNGRVKTLSWRNTEKKYVVRSARLW